MDTGFTGALALPLSAVRRLELPVLGRRNFTLADGGISEMNAYTGTILWHERLRDVVVIQSKGAPLIGMDLLWNNRVTIEALVGGSVIIEEIALI